MNQSKSTLLRSRNLKGLVFLSPEIVSQNSFLLVFWGHCTMIARYVAKWGIAQMCLCETKHQEGLHHVGGSANLPKKSIVRYGVGNDSIAISRDMGPLRPHWFSHHEIRAAMVSHRVLSCVFSRGRHHTRCVCGQQSPKCIRCCFAPPFEIFQDRFCSIFDDFPSFLSKNSQSSPKLSRGYHN